MACTGVATAGADIPQDFALEKFAPLMSRADAAIVSQEELSELICIIDDKGKASPLIDEQGSIIHHLSNLRNEMARLYVVEEH